ncbi:MAG TPA: hypothetical protein VFB42_05415 [Gaiellaceae bacterium]|nr:hypothetical protein [Gaiellaceae bacterium]
MRARLVPLSLGAAGDPGFAAQTERLRDLLAGEAELLPPRPLGAPLPDADAALLPVLSGDAYRRVPELRATGLPLLVLTSEFGTMAMWDWELIGYLRDEGVETLAPYSLGAARTACRALAARRRLRSGAFVVYQDRPGEAGFQPDIFRRFYWWEDECAERMRDRFGVRIEKRSFRELGARARAVTDEDAGAEWERVRAGVPVRDLPERAVLNAVKLYRAIRDDLDGAGDVLAAGVNCLNESASADTTPCLAWDLLYRERGLLWGCEADTVSMLTKFVVHASLDVPILMTNLYPFLMGQAALKHERIPAFPEVDEPENCVLAAHCGYFGLMPQCFACDWALRPKVLAIVDEGSAVIDARLPAGDLTLSKLSSSLDTLVAVEAELTGYAGYPGSDCRNGAVIRVPDGHALMARLPSHHSLLSTGHDRPGFALLGQVFGLRLEWLGR